MATAATAASSTHEVPSSLGKRKEIGKESEKKRKQVADQLESAFGSGNLAEKSTKYSRPSAEDDPNEPPGAEFDDNFEALQTELRKQGKSEKEIQKEVAEAREKADADDHDENDDDDADSATRKKQGEEAMKLAADTPKIGSIKVPIDVSEASVRAASFIRSAWKKGHTDEIAAKLEVINKKIKGLNYQAKRDVDAFTIPAETILSLMPTVEVNVKRWMDTTDTAKKTKLATNVAITCLTLLRDLTACGIPWKSVTPDAVKKVIQPAIEEGLNALGSELSDSFAAYIEREIELPSSHQTGLVVRAKEPLAAVFTHAEKGDIAQARNSLELVKSCNTELVRCNKAVGFKKTDHQLPIHGLEMMLSQYDTLNEQERPRFIASEKLIWATLIYMEGYHDLAAPLATTLQMESTTLPEPISKGYQDRLIEYRNPIAEETLFVTDDESPPDEAQEEAGSSGGRPGQQTEGQGSESNGSSSAWQQTSTGGLQNTTVPGPTFSSGITDLGKVVAVQELGRGHRAIVNIGTTKVPVYKCYPGSAFGRGVLEELSGTFPMTGAVNVRKRRAIHVQSLLAVVQVDTKSTTRAPITKVLVKWNSEKGGKDFAGARDTEWVTKTDLANACGKDWTDRQLKILLSSWQHNLSYLARMKRLGLHPETKRELDDDLRGTMPWLFPISEHTANFAQASPGAKRNKHGPESTDHIKIEDSTF